MRRSRKIFQNISLFHYIMTERERVFINCTCVPTIPSSPPPPLLLFVGARIPPASVEEDICLPITLGGGKMEISYRTALPSRETIDAFPGGGRVDVLFMPNLPFFACRLVVLVYD